MPDDIEDTKRLMREERIRKLRELTKKHEDEIKKAQELLKRSEEEIEEDAKETRQMPIPQLKAVDVGALFGKGTQEDLMHEAKHFRQRRIAEEKEEEEQPAAAGQLEETVAAERIRLTAEAEAEQRRQYTINEIRYAPLDRTKQAFYEVRSEIYRVAEKYGEPNEELMSKLDNIMYATQSKISDGSYVREAGVLHDAARKLKDRYRGA